MVGCGDVEFVSEKLKAAYNALVNSRGKLRIYECNVSPRVSGRDTILRDFDEKGRVSLTMEEILAMGTVGGHKLSYPL